MDRQATQGHSLDDFGLGDPRILVVGCGGAGGNSVHRLRRIGVHGAETAVVNTDRRHLDRVQADRRILLGAGLTRGLGTGGLPEVGLRAAEQTEKELRHLVAGADLTFLTAGLGGGTGTGAAPYIADLARRAGSVVVGMVTMPFRPEKGRQRVARDGLRRMREAADSVIVLDNNRLVDIVPYLPVEQAFAVMDQLISEVIRSITETIQLPSLINLDFADVRALMRDAGTATVLVGENSTYDPERVVVETLANPLLDVDYTGAQGALVHLTSGPTLRLGTAHRVLEGITRELREDCNVKLGTRIDASFEGLLRVIAILTGVPSPSLMEEADVTDRSVEPASAATVPLIP
jgi:cell division protein FtsZ